MRGVSDWRQISDGPKYVWRLADDAGRCIVDMICKLKLTINGGRQLDHFNALRLTKQARRSGIMGVQAA